MSEEPPWVYFGAAIVPESEAVVPVRHGAFLHGETLFETLRAESGRPIWLCEHLARLTAAAHELAFPLPSHAPSEELLIELLRRNRLADARLRLTVTREEAPGWIVTCAPLEPANDARVYREGVSVIPWFPAWPPWGGSGAVAKSGAWMALADAQRRARAEGHWETVRIDERGRVCEGAASNLFWIREGMLETPSRTLGIVDGIVRTKLIALAPELGLPVRELEEPDVQRVLEADEILLTNSIWEIVSVACWGGRPIGTGTVGAWGPRLRQELRSLPGGPLSVGSRP